MSILFAVSAACVATALVLPFAFRLLALCPQRQS